MAGHSKWANIKHRKERADKKKGKIYSRIAKEIISAIKQGGADPKSNSKLKIAIQKAKEANLPNEIIERNIKKAQNADQKEYFYLIYEIYGYGGVGIIVDIMTDNKNRISSDMRIAINKCGGTIAMPNSVAFNFERKGVIRIPKEGENADELFLAAVDLGVKDFIEEEDNFLVYTKPADLSQIKEGLNLADAAIEMVPKTLIECSEENTDANIKLIEWLENIEDVDAVYHNMKVD